MPRSRRPSSSPRSARSAFSPTATRPWGREPMTSIATSSAGATCARCASWRRASRETSRTPTTSAPAWRVAASAGCERSLRERWRSRYRRQRRRGWWTTMTETSMSAGGSHSFKAGLETYEQEADALFHALKAGDEDASWRFKWVHPSFRGRPVSEVKAEALDLADARLVVARDQHFENWSDLA